MPSRFECNPRIRLRLDGPDGMPPNKRLATERPPTLNPFASVWDDDGAGPEPVNASPVAQSILGFSRGNITALAQWGIQIVEISRVTNSVQLVSGEWCVVSSDKARRPVEGAYTRIGFYHAGTVAVAIKWPHANAEKRLRYMNDAGSILAFEISLLTHAMIQIQWGQAQLANPLRRFSVQMPLNSMADIATYKRIVMPRFDEADLLTKQPPGVIDDVLTDCFLDVFALWQHHDNTITPDLKPDNLLANGTLIDVIGDFNDNDAEDFGFRISGAVQQSLMTERSKQKIIVYLTTQLANVLLSPTIRKAFEVVLRTLRD